MPKQVNHVIAIALHCSCQHVCITNMSSCNDSHCPLSCIRPRLTAFACCAISQALICLCTLFISFRRKYQQRLCYGYFSVPCTKTGQMMKTRNSQSSILRGTEFFILFWEKTRFYQSSNVYLDTWTYPGGIWAWIQSLVLSCFWVIRLFSLRIQHSA